MIRKLVEINSIEIEELKIYKTLRFPNDHFNSGLFVSEGFKVVDRLFNSEIEIASILLSLKWFEKFKIRIEERIENIDVFIADDILLKKIVGHKMHQSIMAVGIIPSSKNINEIYKNKSGALTFVALDDIMNAENVGVIVRNCAAFGVDAIITGETNANPYLRRAVRNSMGNIFNIPLITSKNLEKSLVELKNLGVKIISAHTNTKSESIHKINFTKDLCLVLGNEETGPRENILNISSSHCIIPMKNNVDSLNVANASAVLLYEIQKQREN